jgi:hypothetical protein
MKAILLAGYRTPQKHEGPVGSSIEANGKSQLSNQILAWKNFGCEVVVILAGAQADEQLRTCKELIDVELAFDTTAHPNLISNLRAGMHTTEDGAFIFPIELPFPGHEICQFLKAEFAKAGFRTPHALLQALDVQGAPWQDGFPLLVTRVGNKLIRNHDDLTGLIDPRLSYLRLASAA